MGRKKKRTTTSSNKRTAPARSKKKMNLDTEVVIMLVISLLSAVLIYFKSGAVGQSLSSLLGGVFGIAKYIIPVGCFAIAINLIYDDKDYLVSKLIQYGIIICCICTLFSIYEIAVPQSMNVSLGISNVAERAYYLGSMNKGGGVVGGVLAFPLIKLFGIAGTVILAIGLAVIFIVFMFGFKPTEFIAKWIEELRERKNAEVVEENDEPAQATKVVETKRERKLREKEEARLRALETTQLQINFDGNTIDGANRNDLRKYKHDDSDLMPLGLKSDKGSAKQHDPEYIEGNLFKQEEQKKEDNTKEVLQLEHSMIVEDENYEYPPLNLLSKNPKKATKAGAKALTDTAAKLQKTLYSFGVSAKVENVTVGPAITRYELKPAEGVRVSKIANLADDIALNLAAETLRIEAPIPGKQAVGIEVPNKEREAVHLREVIESEEFDNNKSKLSVALGKDVAGQAVVADIAKMPHVLIAGSTGSGKSVCINTIITSIIYNAKPSEVKMVMVDPKVVELSVYNGIPHLLIPVVTDPKKAAGALAWAVQEMDDRYNKFAMKGVRDLKGYNAAMEEDGAGKLPQIIIIIDELADLMMVAAKDVEDSICRLAQKARAAGMHLVIATQRPSVDVITGLIKANVPSRIAFAVSSQVDSRTILDMVGAEKLLGKGDMLFYPAGASKPARIQGAFVSDSEVEKIVGFIKANGTATYNEDILESIENSNKTDKELAEEADDGDDADPLLMEAMDTVVETGQASTSFIQRRFKVGYARAGRIIDQLEERGVISGYQGSKPRQVLMTIERLNELKMATNSETKD